LSFGAAVVSEGTEDFAGEVVGSGAGVATGAFGGGGSLHPKGAPKASKSTVFRKRTEEGWMEVRMELLWRGEFGDGFTFCG
jgi:hypothetical protein